MKKKEEFSLKTPTDIKVFLLFIFDRLGCVLEHATVIEILMESTGLVSLDYDECLRELVKGGHLLFEDFGEEKYYMISDKGRLVSAELYDTLDKSFREHSLRLAAKRVSLIERGAGTRASISETESKRYRVTLEAFDRFGELMSISVTVNSMLEAEAIKQNFEKKPDGVYRGVLFSVTGKLEFIT